MGPFRPPVGTQMAPEWPNMAHNHVIYQQEVFQSHFGPFRATFGPQLLLSQLFEHRAQSNRPTEHPILYVFVCCQSNVPLQTAMCLQPWLPWLTSYWTGQFRPNIIQQEQIYDRNCQPSCHIEWFLSRGVCISKIHLKSPSTLKSTLALIMPITHL